MKQVNHNTGRSGGTTCAIVNQISIGCWINDKKFTIAVRQPNPQLIDSCTYGVILFPCLDISLSEKKNKRKKEVRIFVVSISNIVECKYPYNFHVFLQFEA
jgi:hypothetical protein